MAEHVLKTLPQYWDAIACGEKTFEVRRNDRGFQKGDVLVLRKLSGITKDGYDLNYDSHGSGKYKDIRCVVGWILMGGQFGVEVGHVVMSLHREATNA